MLTQGFPGGSRVNSPAANAGDAGAIPAFRRNQENPLEKEMATHASILAWAIPGTGEPGGPQSRGLQRIGHD